MLKSAALIVAAAQAANLNKHTTVLIGDVNNFDPNKGLIATAPTAADETRNMLGGWSGQQTCSDKDIIMFSAW